MNAVNEKNLERVRFLEGERLFLTPESMDDFDNYYKREMNRELQYLGGLTYRALERETTRKQFESRITSKDSETLSMIHNETGEQLGRIVLFSIRQEDRTAEWGLVIPQEHWRQGYGTEAAKLLLKHAFEDLGLRKLRSATHSGNEGSMKFQESLGCIREGVHRQDQIINGESVDAVWYGMLREEYDRIT